MSALLTILGSVALVLSLVGVGRALGRLRRRLGARALRGPPERTATGVDLVVHLFRTPSVLGMAPGKAHPVRADLLLGRDHLVIATDRGVLVDVGPDHGRRFRAVRCTGPGRLVIEGEVPRTDGGAGLFRLEAVVDDAAGWARALGALLDEDGELVVFEGPTRRVS